MSKINPSTNPKSKTKARSGLILSPAKGGVERINTVVIGVGSNIDPKENIHKTLKLFTEKFQVIGQSEFIKTQPIGYSDQPDFLNGAILIQTYLDIYELTRALKAIEKELGREESSLRYGPRTIDLDIVVFNGKVMDEDFYERQFLKDAVLKLLPDLKY